MKTATAPRTIGWLLTTSAMLLLLRTVSFAQSPFAGFDPGANGDVLAYAVQADGKILVGGSFTMLGGGGTGTTTRNYIGRLNSDGSLDATFNPGANAAVNAIALQSDGKILVGGAFTMLGGGGTGTTPRSYIGRLNSDGSLDMSFNPGANASVATLALQSDGKILAGGSFGGLGGGTGTTLRNRIGRLNSDGTVDTFNPGANGVVSALLVQADGTIILGGAFTMLGGGSSGNVSRNYIGRLYGDGSLDNGFNPGAGLDVSVLALQADGKIVVGGKFTSLAGTARNYIGRLNQDGTLDSSFNPGADNFINALLVQPDGAILVGGSFVTLGGNTRNYVGRLHQDGSLDTSFNPGATSSVSALALEATGKILVGGSFAGLGGGTGATTRNRIGRLYPDGGVDQTIDLAIAPVNSTIYAVALQADGKILIGGQFSTVLGQARTNLARINTDGTLDASYAPNPDSQVSAIAIQPDGAIVVGGSFSTVAGQARNHIARLDPTGATDSFNPAANNVVTCLSIQPDGKVLVGGAFSSIGGQSRNRIARLSSTTGLADSFNPNPNSNVFCLAVQPDGKVLVGGAFTSIGGQTRNRIARLDGSTGLADSFDPNANNSVLAIVVQPDGKILVGGNFNGSFGGQTRNRIARLDGTTGLADSFNPNSLNTVNSIALQSDGKVLIGGTFTNVGGVTRNHIARLDAVSGAPDSFNPSTNGAGVTAVVLQRDGKIVLGGFFTTIGATTRQYFAVLSNDIAAVADLTVSQTSASWTLSGAAAQAALTSFESSNDNVNYSLLGAGTFGGGSWTLSGLSLPAGQNMYLRARGYYGDAYQSGSSSLIEFVRNAFFGVAPAIASANSTTFVVGTAGNFSVTKTGTPAPSLSESGALPNGVSFNGATGALSGTPATLTGGVYPLTFTASNGIAPIATQSFTLTVNEAPNITSANSTTFVVGTPGSFTVTSTGYPSPTFNVSGTLPSGVTLSTSTGVLSGTPAVGTGGTYPITFTASNGVGSNAVQNFTLTVNQAPTITSANNTTFGVGNAGTFTVTRTGFPTPTLSESGALPSGVTFNTTTGVLSGTPAAGTQGTYPITFTASNGVGSNAMQSFTLAVVPPPAPTQVVSRKLHGGTPFDINLPLTGNGGVECRSGGGTNDYQVIFSFPIAVTFDSASVTAGTGAVSGSSGSGTATATVNLTGVTTAQRITVTLLGVTNGTATGDVVVQMDVLVGDTSGNGSVNASDVSQTKLQSGQPLTSANFRTDVNVNGTLNASDVSLVKSKTGTALP